MANYIILDRDWLDKEIDNLISLYAIGNLSDKGQGRLKTLEEIRDNHSVDAIPVFEKCFNQGALAGFHTSASNGREDIKIKRAEFFDDFNPFYK